MGNSADTPLLFLMGPTAAGKTAAAARLVQQFPFDIVSADSALVYQGMDIGTAKPTARELVEAPHRLIDRVPPTARYSAGQFRADALNAIDEIRGAGRLPLVVGGTLLYFRALERGLAQLPRADPGLRAKLDAQAAQVGWPHMHRELAAVDPAAAGRIHPHDAQRIQRALEVFQLTGRPISELQRAAAKQTARFLIYKVAWCPPRDVLYTRCEKRLNDMIEKGFLDELRALREVRGLTREHPAMRAVGYRQFWDFLDGGSDFETARRRALTATRRLAKRQLTWLRHQNGVVWLDPQQGSAYNRLKQIAQRVVQASRCE